MSLPERLTKLEHHLMPAGRLFFCPTCPRRVDCDPAFGVERAQWQDGHTALAALGTWSAPCGRGCRQCAAAAADGFRVLPTLVILPQEERGA